MRNVISEEQLIPRTSSTSSRSSQEPDHDYRLAPPFIEIQREVTEPDQLIPVYSKRNSFSKFLSFIIVAGAIAFDLFIPLVLGVVIELVSKYYIGTLPKEELGPILQHQVMTKLAAVNIVSSIFEWIANDIYQIAASKVSKELRYDIYYCQVRKLYRRQIEKEPIDHEASLAAFHMQDVDEQIQTVHEAMGTQQLRLDKTKIKLPLQLLFLLFLSYKLMLFFLTVFIFVGVIKKCLQIKSSRLQHRLLQLRRELYHVGNDTYGKDADLRERSNTYWQKNKDLWQVDYSYHLYGGFAGMFIFFSIRGIGTFGIEVLQLMVKRNTGEGKGITQMTLQQFGRQDLTVSVIVTFIFTLIFAVRGAATLGSMGPQRKEQLNKLRLAIDKLFVYVRMAPLKELIGASFSYQSTQDRQSVKPHVQTFFEELDRSVRSNEGRESFRQDLGKSLRNSQSQIVLGSLMASMNQKVIFKGSTVYVRIGERTELPVLRAIEPVKLGKLLLGKQLLKKNLPIASYEPMSVLQKQGEFLMIAHDLFVAAAQTDDPTERVARTLIALISFSSLIKIRKKEAFNPILGETYEMVTDRFRFLAQKVDHATSDVIVFELEGEDYVVRGYSKPESEFKWGTKPQVTLNQGGYWDVHYPRHRDDISVTKPTIVYKNVLFGGYTYIDIEGMVEAVSHSTGSRAEVEFTSKAGDKPSRLNGQCFNGNQQLTMKLEGEWQEELRLIDVLQGQMTVLWKQQPLMPGSHLQFFYTALSLALNHTNPQLNKVLPPTDSRRRPDIRLLEENFTDLAQLSKLKIEQRQRKALQAAKNEYAIFFEAVPHPFLKSSTFKHYKPVNAAPTSDSADQQPEHFTLYKLKESDGDFKSYWDRREESEWVEMPNLWGEKLDVKK